MAQKGIGLWHNKKDAAKVTETDIKKMLVQIGYDTEDMRAAAYAFCRRFLPERVATVDDVMMLDGSLNRADEALFTDEIFLQVLKAVFYAYCKASKTPCKI